MNHRNYEDHEVEIEEFKEETARQQEDMKWALEEQKRKKKIKPFQKQ